MSIYSSNRIGSIPKDVLSETEYTANDIGRILYESELNDQAIFEACIASDLSEIKSLREGGDRQHMSARLPLIARIDSYANKLRNVFNSQIKSFATLGVVKNQFIKNFKKKYESTPFNGTANIKVLVPSTKPVIPNIKEIKTAALSMEKNNTSREETISKLLGKSIKASPLNSKEFKEKLKNSFKDVTINSSNANSYISSMLSSLENSKESIKSVMQLQKTINSDIKAIDKELRALTPDIDDFYKKRKALSTCISIYEYVCTTIIGGVIFLEKENIRNSYKALSHIMKNNLGEKSTAINDSAEIVEDGEISDILNDNTDTPEEIKNEVKEAIKNASLEI